MRIRTIRVALVGLFVIALAVGAALAGSLDIRTETFQALAPTPAYQFAPGPPPSAIFTNLTGEDVVGLKLTFTSAVPSLSGYGVGSDASLTSNSGLLATFEGTIPSYGGVYAEWDETEARVLVAQWLLADGSSVPIDLHQPFAKMAGTAAYALRVYIDSVPTSGRPILANGLTIKPQILASFSLDGGRSTTFDSNDIVRYQWEWDDGLIQEGPTVERTLIKTLDEAPFTGTLSSYIGSVTLTVWSTNGASSSVTKAFFFRLVAPV